MADPTYLNLNSLHGRLLALELRADLQEAELEALSIAITRLHLDLRSQIEAIAVKFSAEIERCLNYTLSVHQELSQEEMRLRSDINRLIRRCCST